MSPQIFYLHGFISSPGGYKARQLRAWLQNRGLPLHIPDLNVPDFEHLTLTAQIEKVAEVIPLALPGDIYIIGSSMGGAVALHFCHQYRETLAGRVKKLLLLAPALDFLENRRRQMGEEGLQFWKQQGRVTLYHPAYEGEQALHYGLMEDLMRYDGHQVKIDIPVYIIHGRQDASVDYQHSVRFAATRPNVTLHGVDSDHQMHNQMETIQKVMLSFFELATGQKDEDKE